MKTTLMGLQAFQALVDHHIFPYLIHVRLDLQHQHAAFALGGLVQVFGQRRNRFPVSELMLPNLPERTDLDFRIADGAVVVHHHHVIGRQMYVALTAPATERLRLPQRRDGVLGIVVPVAAMGHDGGALCKRDARQSEHRDSKKQPFHFTASGRPPDPEWRRIPGERRK